MKYILSTLLALTISINAYAAPDMTKGTYDTEGVLVKVEAHGLVCDFCARAVEKVFMKQEAVAGVAVNLSEHLIMISLKKGQDLDDETLTKLIEDSGYNVAGINREGEQKEVKE